MLDPYCKAALFKGVERQKDDFLGAGIPYFPNHFYIINLLVGSLQKREKE